MASLWIGSGEGLAIKIEDPDYQVGARFEALDEGVLAAASKTNGYFFAISIFLEVRCINFAYLLHLANDSDIKERPQKLHTLR